MKAFSQCAWRLCLRAAQTRILYLSSHPSLGRDELWMWSCPRTMQTGLVFYSFICSFLARSEVLLLKCRQAVLPQHLGSAPYDHLCRSGCSGGSSPLFWSYLFPWPLVFLLQCREEIPSHLGFLINLGCSWGAIRCSFQLQHHTQRHGHSHFLWWFNLA